MGLAGTSTTRTRHSSRHRQWWIATSTSSRTPLASKEQLSMWSVLRVLHHGKMADLALFFQTAAAKGLVAGQFTLTSLDGTTVRRGPDLVDYLCMQKKKSGTLMVVVLSHRRRQRGTKGQFLKSEMDTGYRERSKSPHTTVSSSFVADEFQSTFRTLASSNLHQHSRAGKGIILTVRSSASHSHTSANGHPGKRLPRHLHPRLPPPPLHLAPPSLPSSTNLCPGRFRPGRHRYNV